MLKQGLSYTKLYLLTNSIRNVVYQISFRLYISYNYAKNINNNKKNTNMIDLKLYSDAELSTVFSKALINIHECN